MHCHGGLFFLLPALLVMGPFFLFFFLMPLMFVKRMMWARHGYRHHRGWHGRHGDRRCGPRRERQESRREPLGEGWQRRGSDDDDDDGDLTVI